MKSFHITFTLRKENYPPVSLNNIVLPQSSDVKYLGLHLDRRLTWNKHIRTKRKQLDLTLRKLHWLVGRRSRLSDESKITLYKAILKPIWTYGIQLWGTASASNIKTLERFQTKFLRQTLHIPWYVKNTYILQDLQLDTVKQEISRYSLQYERRLNNHPNCLALNLLDNTDTSFIRLRRYNVLDLIYRFDDNP